MTKRIAAVLMALGLATQVVRGDAWQDLAKYKYGEGNAAEEAEKIVQAAPLDQRGPLEDALIAVVTSKDATEDGKSFACRLLQRIGTEKCIPAVGSLLSDEILSGYARLVLERVKSPKADEVLRAGLAGAPDKAKVGIIASLGERRDTGAVKDISAFAGNANAEIAAAALVSLGKIGGKVAGEFLAGFQPADGVKNAWLEGLVRCGKTLTGPAAVSMFDKAIAGDKASYRIAAIGGMVDVDAKKAIEQMTKVMNSDDVVMRNGVLTLIAVGKGEEVTKAMAALVSGLSDEKKVEMMIALGARGDKAALGAIAPGLSSTNNTVCEAAIQAVGKIGDAAAISALLGSGNPKAIEALVKMPGSETDGTLIAALSDSKLKESALKALVARSSSAAVPQITKLTNDKDAGVRKAAWNALGSLASEADMNALAKAAFAVKDPEECAAAVGAVRNVTSGSQDKAKSFEVMAGFYDGASDTAKSSILDFASAVGGPAALAVEKKAVKSGNKELFGKAVRALAAWKDETAADDLLAAAKSGQEEADRIVALRGYLRIAGGQEFKLSATDRMAMFKKADPLAKSADDKKQIIGGLRLAGSADALNLLAKYWDDAQVRNEVEQAAMTLMWDLRTTCKAEAKALATKLLGSGNGGVVDKAKQTLAEIK